MSLYLNGKKYRNGTVVRANPVEQATGTLQKIGIGSDVYNISGSGTQQQADWAQTDNTAVDYIKNKPNLATVATSGDYDDLTNKPTIPAAQVNSDWNSSSGVSQILNKPTLATVATSGAYSDLSGTPSLATVATSGSYSDLSNKPTIPSVEANPSGTASATLSTLEVDGTIYNVPSGGGSDLPLTVENGKLCIIYET